MLKKFLRNIKDSILNKYFYEYLTKIEYLESQYEAVYVKYKSEQEKNSLLKLGQKSLQAVLNDIINDQKLLLTELNKLRPREVTKPTFLTGKLNYRPRRRYVSKNKDFHVYFEDPTHVFDKSTMLYDLMKQKGLLNCSQTHTNLSKIHKLMISLSYDLDKLDNWRSVTDVLLSKHGDCEESAVLITSALGMAGWKANEVFVAVGHYNKTKSFGHAWAVAQCNGRWYVLEGTNKSAKPIIWKNVKEIYVADWGILNWRYSGMIKNNWL